MINSYCRVCGLFISVGDDFAGGWGRCPRCKTPLRIPRPLPTEHPQYDANLRYIAEPSLPNLAPKDHLVVISPSLGPSSRYHCKKCGEQYESLAAPHHEQGQCPACGTINAPVHTDVAFARLPREQSHIPIEELSQIAQEEQKIALAEAEASQTAEAALPMEDGFLVAEAASREPQDGEEIIQGKPYSEEEEQKEQERRKREEQQRQEAMQQRAEEQSSQSPAQPSSSLPTQMGEPKSSPQRSEQKMDPADEESLEFLEEVIQTSGAASEESPVAEEDILSALELEDDEQTDPVPPPPEGIAEDIPAAGESSAPTKMQSPAKELGEGPLAENAEWFYLQAGEKIGPSTPEELRQLLFSGKINRSVLVWHKGMEGWEPLEEVEELGIEKYLPASPQASATTPKQKTRRLETRCMQMLWVLLGGACLVLAMLVMRGMFVDLGIQGSAGLLLGLLCLGGAAYSGAILIQSRSLMDRLESKPKFMAIGALAGLVLCGALIFVIGFWPTHQEVRKAPPPSAVQRAQTVFNALTDASLADQYNPDWDQYVAWTALKVEDQNFGQEYLTQPQGEARYGMILDFLSFFEDTYNPTRVFADSLPIWTLDARGTRKEIIAWYSPDKTGKQLHMVLEDGKLIAIDLVVPGEQTPEDSDASTLPSEDQTPQADPADEPTAEKSDEDQPSGPADRDSQETETP